MRYEADTGKFYMSPEELGVFTRGTIYADDDPAQYAVTADIGEWLQFERIVRDH